MSKKKPVMSHDPLAELGSVPAADGDAVSRAVQIGGEGMPSTGPVAAKVIKLPSTLTIAEAGELHAVLVEHVLAVASFSLDAGDVETVDSAGIQLLAAVWKSAAVKGIEIKLLDPSPALCTAVRQIGLANLLDVQDCETAA